MANKGASSNRQRRNTKVKSSKIRQYTENLASLQSANVIDATRLSALADMSQRQSDKLMSVVAQEETQLQKQLKTTYLENDSNIQNAIQTYTEELSKLYYDSSSSSINNIVEGTLPTLDVIVNAINEDPIFNNDKLTPAKTALLNYAKKIKTQLESRISLEGRLKNSVLKLIGNDAVIGALAGAATKSPLIALGVFALSQSQSKKKNNYASRYAAKEKQLNLAKNQNSRQSNTPNILNNPTSNEAKSTNSVSETPKVNSTASQFKGILGSAGDYAIPPDASTSAAGIGRGSEIVKILKHHTSLLQSIYKVNTQSLKIQESQLAKQIAAAEEGNLETQGGVGSKSTTSKSTSRQNNENDEEDDDNRSPIDNILDSVDLFRRRPRSPRIPRRGRNPISRFLRNRQAAGLRAARAARAAGGGGIPRLLGGASRFAGATRFLAPLARVAGKAAVPLAVGMAGYDAYKGWNADASLSTGGKALNATKGILSGLTFGLSDHVTGGVSHGEQPTPQTPAAPPAPTAQPAAPPAPTAQPAAPPAPTAQPAAPLPTTLSQTNNATRVGKGKLLMPSTDVETAIDTASKKVGVDKSIMMAMAKQESGFNPKAKAGTSSASGLYQFINSTWKNMVEKYGNKFPELMKGQFDVDASAIAGALYIKENSAILQKNNIPISGTSIYAAHFLGPGGAVKLFNSNPSVAADSIFGKAAQANKNIFYTKEGNPRTIAEVQEILYNKVGKFAEQYATALGISTTTPITSSSPTSIAGTEFGGGKSGGGGASGSWENMAASGGVSAAPIASGAPAAPTPAATPAGDTTADGRAAVSGGLASPVAPISGGGGGVTNIVQGGNTMMGGGGGGSATQIIPAPIDREPTIRRILDGSLS